MNDFDIIRNLLVKDRTVRIFDSTRSIDKSTLEKLIELTRFCASGRNLQPLRYRIIDDEVTNEEVFPLLAWAGYYTDWDGPEKDERPVAYLVQCIDKNLTEKILCDDGLQLQAITLGATSLGIGCCIIKSFNVAKLKTVLKLEDRYEPIYVLALGYPKETVKIEDLESDQDSSVKYYRTPDGVHHVPKRKLSDLII